MAQRVRKIEVEAVRLAWGLLMAVPRRYRVKPINVNDPEATAWLAAVDGMTRATKTLEALGNLLEEPEDRTN
jgi:hypothetical protein